MNNYTIITNNCQTIYLYNLVNREYDNPFIGSYFQSDEQFIKFCSNYNYYINVKPEFKDPILPFDTTGPIKPNSYPTMFLDDIEISWIHETSKEECLKKYFRRLERGLNKIPFFILGDSLLHQYHTDDKRKSLIDQFESINNSFYIKKEYSDVWKDCKHDDRNPGNGFARPTTWIKPDTINELIIKYFNERHYLKDQNIIIHVYALCYNESRLLPHFFKHYENVDKIIIYDNESTDNSVEIIKKFKRDYIIFKTDNGFNDIIHKNIKNNCWKQSIGIADFVIIQDLDEFVHFPDHPYDIKKGFYDLKLKNAGYVKCIGYEMCCSDEEFNDIPHDKNIFNYIKKGFYSFPYCKPIIINPNIIVETNYCAGSHIFDSIIPQIENTKHNVLLLHFKHIGIISEFTKRIEYRSRRVTHYSTEYGKNDKDTMIYIKEFHDKAEDITHIIFNKDNHSVEL